MKNLYILSPSDRFNYGDLLFSHILNHYLKEVVDNIYFCSIIQSDFSSQGAIRTYGFNKILETKETDDNYLIIGGGESLFTQWNSIYSFLYKDVDSIIKYKNFFSKIPIINNLYITLSDLYIKKRYPYCTKFPFTIGLHEIPNFKAVLYNSVGSANLFNQKKIIESVICKDILKSSAYISVRDSGALKGLNEMGIECSLFPDSAILLSEVFTNSFIKNSISKEINKLKIHSNYIFFQINLSSSLNKEVEWANLLSSIYKKTNKKIVLCPIGTALGHSDDIALKNISQNMCKDSFVIINNPSIWDIMYLIKNSNLYLGTSLHGAITAMSFSVPFITHGKLKVKQYIKDWGGIFTESTNIEELILSQLKNTEIKSYNEQKNLAKESISNIKKIIMQ